LRVLRDKFEWSAADLQDVVRVMEGCARRVEAEESVDVITYDLPDNRILECAQAAASDFIVSGDKDLLRLGKFGEARILKAAELLGIAKGKGQER
jgi:predicted nucleic acid-binding protein